MNIVVMQERHLAALAEIERMRAEAAGEPAGLWISHLH